jgi:hypothetical protein
VTARFRRVAVLTIVALGAAACAPQDPPRPAFSGDISKGNPTESEVAGVEPPTEAPPPTPLTPEQAARLQVELSQVPPGCDVFGTKNCLLPFPNDAYTVRDTSTGTDRRVNLPTGQLPNVDGVTFDPSEWNRNDGWSPSTPIIAFVPDLDPEATNLPPEDDIGMSVTPESSTVIVDLDTGQLVPHWAEMDSRADSPEDRALILRPAASLIETHRFAVGLRRMIGTRGVPLPAPMAFQAFRDNKIVDDPRITQRQEEYNIVFNEMAAAGVDRTNLYLSWYFTVAGPDTLSSRLLSMRDDTMGRLAGGAPPFTVEDVDEDAGSLEEGIARVVTGTFEAPLYLDRGGAPGARMVYSPLNGDPLAVGTYTSNFTCVVPEKAVQNGEAYPVVYGHGLLGSSGEVTGSAVQRTAAELNAVYCGTDAIGLSEGDVGNAIEVLGDLSRFPTIPDRLQQSMLNTLVLGRLMLTEEGLGAESAFQTEGGANLMNTDQAFYDGNSQGAIIGGAVTAVAQDWNRAVLGVGGMNYSTLLNRSVDFDRYFEVMRAAYPDPLEQQIWFGLLQMLWDRGETSGYVQHLTTRTYDRTPPKQVLMTVAFGDHQVATVTADNIARTLNIPIYRPVLPEDVSPMLGAGPGGQSRFWYDLEPIRSFPANSSALYYWYYGTLPPPPGNITPTMSTAFEEQCSGAAAETEAACRDPHGFVRRQEQVIAQKKAFFETAQVINACKDEPCVGEPPAG